MPVNLKVLSGIILSSILFSQQPTPATAETSEIRVICSIGLQFLPTYVAVDKHLIEKHAMQLGIANPKVVFNWVTNGGAMNDALISGNSDVGQIPGPALVLLWNRTRGAQAIRGVAAGVPLNYAEIMAALLSGGTEVKSGVMVPPFTQDLLETGKVRQVLSLDDVLGGHGTLNVFTSTEKFHSQNPKAFAAVKAAIIEAMEFIRDNPREAAEIYLKREPNKHGLDWIEALIKDKKAVGFTADPHRFEKLATYLHKSGAINAQPASWKDLFFDQGEGLNGN
jgi:ABC-type nitrate/sulfonate/bicarbonate transport system substrate-binding protein